MPDWIKRINKEQPQDIEPDETVIAACFFQGRGTAAGLIAFGMIRGIGTNVLGVGSALSNVKGIAGRDSASKSAQKGYNTPEGSTADQFPNDKGVVAVTDRRIVIFGYSQGAFKTKVEPAVATIDRADLVGWSYKSGKLISILNLAFVDESDVGIELPRANKPDQFAAALEIPAME